MALPALAGFALRGIGSLIKRRRGIQALRGASFGKAINTQPQGPPQGPVTGGTPGLGSAAINPSVVGTNQTRPEPGMSAGFDANVAKAAPGQNTTVGSQFGGGPTIGTTGSGRDMVAERAERIRRSDEREARNASGAGQVQTQNVIQQPQLGQGEGQAAALGVASIARSRRRNRQQQATLSNAALA
ncbi:hypothetical protein LCGC14_0963340 [marine sediment metagenome]|uniref:Uncharacterized protein n=1 Tax=marine sediment metagenome TaxID=412755 RepID=A0A0F9NDV2_9ZZZZ